MKKISSKPTKLYLKVKDGFMGIVSINPFFIRANVPVEDFENGVVAVEPEVFDNILSSAGTKISLELVGNTLKVNTNVKYSIYVLDVGSDDTKTPKVEESKRVKLSGKGVGILKVLLDGVRFKALDDGTGNEVLICASKDGTYVGIADSFHCAFYDSKEKIVEKGIFKLTANLNQIREVLNAVGGMSTIDITDNFIFVKSDSFIVSLPAIESNESLINDARSYLDDSKFRKGHLELEINSFKDKIKSVSAIGEGKDVVNIKIDEKNCNFNLESTKGKSSIKFKIKKNTIGKVDIGAPSLLLADALEACTGSTNIIFKLDKNNMCYKLEAENKDTGMLVRCISQLSNK